MAYDVEASLPNKKKIIHNTYKLDAYTDIIYIL